MAIVSFTHNFIFVKTTKTAGTSIEVDLSRIAGQDAVVTPIQPPEPGHEARNWCDADGRPLYRNHMAATELRARLGAARFGAMFRFCVEREPVDKCISHFHMQRNSPLHNPDGSYTASWDEYCAAGKFPTDLSKYSEVRDGRRVLLVDRVLRYDRLHEELGETMAGLGLAGFGLTSRAKSGYSRPRLVHPDEVTDAQRARIYEVFAPALELTGIDWRR